MTCEEIAAAWRRHQARCAQCRAIEVVKTRDELRGRRVPQCATSKAYSHAWSIALDREIRELRARC